MFWLWSTWSIQADIHKQWKALWSLKPYGLCLKHTDREWEWMGGKVEIGNISKVLTLSPRRWVFGLKTKAHEAFWPVTIYVSLCLSVCHWIKTRPSRMSRSDSFNLCHIYFSYSELEGRWITVTKHLTAFYISLHEMDFFDQCKDKCVFKMLCQKNKKTFKC